MRRTSRKGTFCRSAWKANYLVREIVFSTQLLWRKSVFLTKRDRTFSSLKVSKRTSNSRRRFPKIKPQKPLPSDLRKPTRKRVAQSCSQVESKTHKKKVLRKLTMCRALATQRYSKDLANNPRLSNLKRAYKTSVGSIAAFETNVEWVAA